jgi:hypothetical protein
MKYGILLCLVIWHPVLLGAQEHLALNADLARQESPKQIAAMSGTIITRGTDHGPPPPPAPVTLTMISLTLARGSADIDPLHRAKVLYEFRLTNTGTAPIDIPVSPDLSKIFLACPLDGQQQVGLVLTVKSGDRGEETRPGTSVWSGCPTAKGSIVTISHGEWITYRGSATVSLGVGPPGTVTGMWMISDVRYDSAPDGLTQNTKTTVYASSDSWRVE